LLRACSMNDGSLICVRESATKPSHIIRLSLKDGTRKVLYDPNAAFDARRFGEVSTLYWKDRDGVEGFGHLVKPLGYQKGRKYPLVVVQYRSRGFLRGGVGDEFPIHVLAARGFAVLSFHRPDNWELLAHVASEEERERQLWKAQSDRRRVLSVLQAGIALLERDGIVDSTRVGISGVSDGANTATYALIHAPTTFAAAAVAGTYWNPVLYYLSGPALQERVTWFGLDAPESDVAVNQWRQLSLALNAATIRAPLLIQVSDAELLPETQTASALAREGKPFEMHVFPNEFHLKTQPRHRLNAYRRSVQWFLFWLRNIEEDDPVDEAQYERWRKLRAQQLSSNRE
jgi:dipeptidyl aminopeptidase/acylaminoacyl peptidase